jgi:RNA polymerase-binding transcription factor DksA
VTDAQPHPVHDVPGTSRTSAAEDVDLDAVERDLAAVEVALERLNEGTYWTDEVTGEPIPEHILADDPTARRA